MSLDCVVNRFRLLGPLGRGNMGEVHRAADLLAAESDPGREVAAKLILRGRTGALIDTYADEKAVQRFEREVRIMRRLAPVWSTGDGARRDSEFFGIRLREPPKKLAVRT